MSGFEMRDQGDGVVRFAGYACVFDHEYRLGAFSEVVLPNAFTRTLQESPDVALLVSHGGLPLARTKPNRTLRLTQDTHGLHVDADLDGGDPEVQSLQRKYQRGDLTGEMSFAFMCTDDSWDAKFEKRTIKSVSIHKGDVSIVPFGASDVTSSSFRSLTLEQRRRRAEELGRRMVGSAGQISRFGEIAHDDRLTGVRSRVSVPDFTSRARQEFDAMLAREGFASFEAWQRATR